MEAERPPAARPDGELRELAARAVGDEPSLTFRGWPHGVTAVWEVRARGETRAFLKVHTQSRKYARERRAYREWVPRLPGPHPRLLAEDDASEVLRALHDLPLHDSDHPPLDEVLAGRLRIWLERAGAERLLGAGEREWAARAFGEGAAFRGLEPVPCHRDYGPRNWLVVPDGGRVELAVLDFEHADPDLCLMDLVKLWDGPWVNRPDREASFWAGYGRALAGPARARLRLAGLLYGVGTVVWSAEHGDRAYERHGREVLRRLQRELG